MVVVSVVSDAPLVVMAAMGAVGCANGLPPSDRPVDEVVVVSAALDVV